VLVIDALDGLFGLRMFVGNLQSFLLIVIGAAGKASQF